MLRADLIGRKEAQKGPWRCGGLDGGAPPGLFTLDNANHGSDDHAGLFCSFDGSDRRGAGGADVVNNDDARAFAAKALDAAAGSVGLFGLADEKAVEEPGTRFGAGMGERAPCAGRGHVGDDGIGAHGEATDGFRVDLVGFE